MKKIIAIAFLLINFMSAIFSDIVSSENPSKQTLTAKSNNVLEIYDNLDRILCRQIIYMSSTDNRDAIKGDNIKYNIAQYLMTLPKEQKEHIRSIVIKQMDSMDEKGISYDPEERDFVKKHPVDLSILMMMYFNHYGLNELDSSLYDKEAITILQNLIKRFKK